MVTDILLQSYLAKHVRCGPTLVDPARGHCYRLGVKTCKWNGLASESVANGSVVSLTYPVEADNAGKLATIRYRSIVLEMMLLSKGSPWYVGLSAAGWDGTGSYL
jgi:hypothetical protein